MISLAFVSHGWILFAMAPIFALGGIGMPAQQSLTTRQVDADRQGQPQGCWPASAPVFGPPFFSFICFGARGSWPGAIWLVATGVYLLALPLMPGIRRLPKPVPAPGK